MKRFLRNDNDVRNAARAILAERIRTHRGAGAAVVGLRGDLGAGKTTLVQHLAREMGVNEHITSPTFVIQKVYELPSTAPYNTLVHIDAYRLVGGKDLAALRWNETVRDNEAIVCIEWPEFVSDALPADTLYVDLTHVDETTRHIEW